MTTGTRSAWIMIAAIAVASGCGKGSGGAAGSGSSSAGGGSSSAVGSGTASAAVAAPAVPRVAAAHARPASGKVFVRIDRDGTIAIGEIPHAAIAGDEIDLAALGAGDQVAIEQLHDQLRARAPDAVGRDLRIPPANGGGGRGTAMADDAEMGKQAPPTTADADDEAGGTGTAMALDEGKMGKKDSDRAEGQYTMAKTAEEEQLARQHAIDAARKAGILGSKALQRDPGSIDDDGSNPVAWVAPAQRDDRDLTLPFLVVDPQAPAGALLDVVRATGGRGNLAVTIADGTRARASRVVFGLEQPEPAADDDEAQLVLSLDAGEAHFAIRPGAPDGDWDSDADPRVVADEYTKHGARPHDVWLVAEPHLVAQRPLAVMDALIDRGVRRFTVSTATPTPTGHGAGDRGGNAAAADAAAATAQIGQPSAIGDLDKAIIRRYVKRSQARIAFCYEKELLAKPSLQGTVTASFFIAPSGGVTESKATGVDPAVASCVADVIKAIEFPKPKGGGGVQVTYPFTFHATGP